MDGEIEAVYITTPVGLHAEQTTNSAVKFSWNL